MLGKYLVRPVKRQLDILKGLTGEFKLAVTVDVAFRSISALTVFLIVLLPVYVALPLALAFIAYVEAVSFEEHEFDTELNDWLKLTVTGCGANAWTGNEMIRKFATVVWSRLDIVATRIFNDYLRKKFEERVGTKDFTVDTISLGSNVPHMTVSVDDDVTKVDVSVAFRSTPPFIVVNYRKRACLIVSDVVVRGIRIRLALNDNFGGELCLLRQPEFSWRHDFIEEFRDARGFGRARRFVKAADSNIRIDIRKFFDSFTYPKSIPIPDSIGRDSVPGAERPPPELRHYEVTLTSVRGLGHMPATSARPVEDFLLNFVPDKFETHDTAVFRVSVAGHTWTSEAIHLTNGIDKVGLTGRFSVDDVADYVVVVEVRARDLLIAKFFETLGLLNSAKELAITYYLPMERVYPNESFRKQPKLHMKLAEVERE